MSDEVIESTESNATEGEAQEVAQESTPESNEEGGDNTESGEAKQSTDSDAEKGESNEEGADDSGEVEFKVEDFTLPEGVEVDETTMGEFLKIANNKELSAKDRHQELVSLYAARQTELATAQLQQWEDVRNGWKAEVKADKEIGGKALDENLSLVQKVLSQYGSKELKEFGDNYGWSDNPEYLKMMVRIGKELPLGEDNLSKGNPDSKTPIESRWYGSDDKN